MEAVGGLTLIVFFALLLAAGLVVVALPMWIGAKLAGIPHATLGKALAATIASMLVTWLVTGVGSIVPVAGTLAGFIIGLLLTLMVIAAVFETTYGKALLAWLFQMVAQVVLAAVAGMLILGSAFTIFG